MSKRILSAVLLCLFFQVMPLKAQIENDQYDNRFMIRPMKPISLIDLPTANFISRRHFQLKLRMYYMGGMLVGLKVGLTPRLMFGVTYGGQNIIGYGKMQWNASPGVNVRYRLRFEDLRFPAVSMGFNSQGYGKYYPELNRYQIKSRGFYIVASKNYIIIKDLGLHGGINYSAENTGAEKDLNFFIGGHLMLDRELTLLWEYDFAINDNDEQSIGTGKGYFNVGVRWAFSRKLLLEFSVKNLLKNSKMVDGLDELPNESRELKIIYFETL